MAPVSSYDDDDDDGDEVFHRYRARSQEKEMLFCVGFFFLPAALKTVPVPSPRGLAERVTQIWGCVLSKSQMFGVEFLLVGTEDPGLN